MYPTKESLRSSHVVFSMLLWNFVCVILLLLSVLFVWQLFSICRATEYPNSVYFSLIHILFAVSGRLLTCKEKDENMYSLLWFGTLFFICGHFIIFFILCFSWRVILYYIFKNMVCGKICWRFLDIAHSFISMGNIKEHPYLFIIYEEMVF